MRKPRSDVVLRRFMAGESVEEIADWMWNQAKGQESYVDISREVQAALRRGWLRMEARARKKARRK